MHRTCGRRPHTLVVLPLIAVVAFGLWQPLGGYVGIMYIGIGTVVLIIVIVLVIMLLRRA